MNTQRRTIGVVACFTGLVIITSYASLDATKSAATPDPETTTTSPPAPTTTLRDRADGLPFTLPDPSVFPTSVAIPATVVAGEIFAASVTCPFIAEEPVSVLIANLDGFATPDPNPNALDLKFPPGVYLQLNSDSALPDDNGVLTFYPVAPTSTGPLYVRAACANSDKWRSDALEFFNDGSTYSQYMYTPPELMHRIDVVAGPPTIATLPESR